MSDAMQRRLDMLLNISVQGLQDVDKATHAIRRHGSKAKAVALGLTEIEGAAENAGRNFDAFREAAARAGTALSKYNDIQDRLKAQQSELAQLTEQRASSMAQAEERSVEAAQNLQNTFEDLKDLYARAEEAAGTTFKPLEEEAGRAKVSMRQLEESLSRIEDSYRKMEAAAGQPRDASGRFAQQPTEGGAQVDPQRIEQERAALMERANIIRETIERVNELTEAQQRYTETQQQITEIERRMGTKMNASSEAVQQLTQRRDALVRKIQREGEVLNQLSGQSLVSVNRETGEASVRTKELDGILRQMDETTKRLNTEMERNTREGQRATQAKEGVTNASRRTTDSLEDQNREWNVMRQRISKNDEALWGLRRSLGALRNQILVVLFATRGLRNAMSSARETIIEVDQGMIGLRRTAISMGEDFRHLEGITREFEKRGLQNADEAAVALRNILQTGLGTEEATNLLWAFTDAASFNARSQRDLTDAVIRASEAFRDQRAQGLQAIGVSQRMTDMVRSHAAATGQQASEIEGLERHMAIYQAVMNESAKFTGNANDLLNTFEGSMISLQGAAKSNSEAFGNTLRPVFEEFNRTLTRGHQSSAEFFNQLNEAHSTDIDRWAARVAKFVEELSAVVGAAGGTILKLIIKYGDWLVIIGQVLLAKSILNKRMAKHAEKMMAMQSAVKNQTVATQEYTTWLGNQNTKLVAVNKVTGEQVEGLQALRVAYQKNRLEAIRSNTALQAGIKSGDLKIATLSKKQASLHTLSGAYAGVTTAITTNTNAVLANKGAKTRLRMLVVSMAAPFRALGAAVTAAGGAMRAAAIAARTLMAAFLKFAAIFLVIQVITRLISRLTGASERANELTMANERLKRSYQELAGTVERASRRFDAVRERADIFGVDIGPLKQVEDQVREHYDRLLELKDKYIQSEDEDQREQLKGRIERLKEALNEERDILEMMSQEKLETFQKYEELLLDLQEKSQEAQTDLLSHHGVQQLHEARQNNREFEALLRERHEAIKAITHVSETARIRFERWADSVRTENTRQANEEQKELHEDLYRTILDTERNAQLDRLSLGRETTENLRRQFEIRRQILKDENEETIQGYEERVEGLRQVQRAERQAIEERVQATTIGIQNEIKAINEETRRLEETLGGQIGSRVGQRMEFIGPFEEFANQLDDLNRKLVEADGPEQFQRVLLDMNDAMTEFEKTTGRDSPAADALRYGFSAELQDLEEHTRNWISNMEDSAKAAELNKREVRPLLNQIEALTDVTFRQAREVQEHTSEMDREISAYETKIQRLREAQREMVSNLNEEERLQVSALELSKAYEAVEKAVEKVTRAEDQRARRRDINDTRAITQMELNYNRTLLESTEKLNEATLAQMSNNRTIEESRRERQEQVRALRGEKEAVAENLQELQREREMRKGLLAERDLEEMDKRIEQLKDEKEFLGDIIQETVILHGQQSRLADQEARLELSRAHLTHITDQLNDAQQEFNDKLQHQQELMSIREQTHQTQLLQQELTARERLLPVMGHILSDRREGINAMRTQLREQRNEIELLNRQRQAIGENARLLRDYINNNEDLRGQERLQAQERLQQLEQQYQWMGELTRANEEYLEVLERQTDTERRQELTRSIVDNLQPTIDMYQNFAQQMREIDDQILLDRHRFRLEYLDQLKHGEITHAEHSHIMLAQQQYLNAREQHLRQERIANLVRDVGREISLYAARIAAQSGNIPAALGLLAGGAIMATANAVASRIERQSTMAYQQAQIEFQRAQRQMQDSQDGMSGDDSRSRKFGGTIRADNMVVNISPTVVVEGEQIFIGSGSAVEFSREMAEMMMENIQQSIDDRRIDLSNVPRGE